MFEDAGLVRDLRLQERAGAVRRSVGVASPAVFHAVSPIHGEPVVFAPGELLPEWAAHVLPDALERYVGSVLVLDATRPAVKVGQEAEPVRMAPRRAAVESVKGRGDW